MFSLQSLFSPLARVTQPSGVFCRYASLLGNLSPAPNSQKNLKRVGRGPQSGMGKTSRRGQKGQKARNNVNLWFEGGQTPYYRLFPKRGFRNVHALDYVSLNLFRVQEYYQKGFLNIPEGGVLDMCAMKKCGLVTGNPKDGIKLLGFGSGQFTAPLKIEASKATPRAIRAIEKAGGSFVAKYHNRMGYRAHLTPGRYISKYGRMPLEGRPIKKKLIEYYSDESRRGYLVYEKTYLAKLAAAGNAKASSKAKKNSLDAQLEAASDKVCAESNKVIRFEDFVKM
ncbi:hypothetical protein BABINDRAFT_33740 [Babjeviella inositovora NRRL Y-12698]|uniref:Large ribosomal subunit protein uL15/eL18 domain-containing protein n=1 Tax=Babjeviella inositovora NRRL Y-12698 TaxID=984486 RepID=A0A1E3QUE6_9ASCO|nr:uncharacterized protein BABINDRAFT_33740 [Babjeviella inositovora NRRL Y-12698]ODQ81311.1 hypothetical protein BABINDRAFT_33740 [Babjeviella inositovora NRRL Y-12698]